MKNLIENFYHSFENPDAEGMVECYHDEVTFEDPAFGILRGEHTKNMWRMLCKNQQGKDFKIKASDFEVQNDKGKARWEAYYTFSRTGRKVHNIINAEFEFKNGKIINHTDNFDLYRWARRAFGFNGWLLGWSQLFKKKLNAQTNKLLSNFEKTN